MKVFYLTGSIVFTVLILILAFENIGSTCSNLNFFFYAVTANPTLVILGMGVLGVITGVFYHAFISKLLATTEEEEDESFE